MNDNIPPKACRINESRNSPSEQAQHPLCAKLLVYGTLKRGYWNHDRYCRNAIDIRPATTWGRLYALPAGYPALEIPEEHILAHGTAEPLTDAATQADFARKIANMSTQSRPTGDWDLIHGEFITFADPARDLAPIDRLEGFQPSGFCMYRRVLTMIHSDSFIYPAWIYIGETIHKDGFRVRRWPCHR